MEFGDQRKKKMRNTKESDKKTKRKLKRIR